MSKSNAEMAANRARAARTKEYLANSRPNISALVLSNEKYESVFRDWLNWLAATYAPADCKSFALAYVDKNQLPYENLDKVADFEFNQVGKMAFLLNEGGELEERVFNKIKPTFDELELKGKKIADKELMKAKYKKPVRNVALELSDEIQDLIILNSADDETLADMIFKSEMNQIETNVFIARVKAFLSDWEDTDPQFVEMREIMGAEKTAYFLDKYRTVIKIAGMLGENIKATRKSARKNKSFKEQRVERTVKNVRTKKVDMQYNIVSLPAEEIVGAKVLLTFNTKNRRLGYYVAASEEGLSAKGSSILNYDDAVSFSKIVRNPERDLPAFRSAKNERRVEVLITENIKGVTHKLTGRLNADTVILKVFK